MNALLDIPHSSPEPKKGIVKKLSQRHRELARVLGMGNSPAEAAAILRLSPSWISQMQRDPSFQQLVKFYETTRDTEFQRTAEKLATLTETAIDELQDRLESEPEEFTPGQLTDLLKTVADRTGFGPSTTHRHLHMAVSPDDLERIKQKVTGDSSRNVELVSTFQGKILGSVSSDGNGAAGIAEAEESDSEKRPALPKESRGEDFTELA